MENTTFNSITVRCRPGFDGGLPQTFVCEVRYSDSGDLATNRSRTRQRPIFEIVGVAPNTRFLVDVYSVNAKGRSDPARMEAVTRKPRPEDVVKFSYSAGTYLSVCALYVQHWSPVGLCARL